MKLFQASFLAILIVFLITNLKQERFKNKPTELQQLPDDLFSDWLDNNMGLNKKHRHHSF